MTLVGRDAETDALKNFYSECVNGKGLVTVIRGPVGSGKTALLESFAERAAALGALFLSATGSRAESSVPLGILDQLLQDSPLPDSPLPDSAASALTEGPRPTVRLFEYMRTFISGLAARQPVVIAVDDVHYADADSLRFLSYLARRLGDLPVFIVLTECPQMLPTDRALYAETVSQGNCRRLCLEPLSLPGVGSLLGEYVDAELAQLLAPACYSLTGGNPLLVHALGEDSRLSVSRSSARLVPRRAFRSAIVTCLYRYEPKTVELAQAMAVLAEEPASSLLGEILGATAESITQGIDLLNASGVLVSGSFRHRAARRAVVDHMTADERGRLHDNVALALYKAGGAPVAVADHLILARAADAPWAVTILQEAAEQSLADGDRHRAIRYLVKAESLCGDERQRADTRFALARAEWPANPERAGRRLAALADEALDNLLSGECVTELASYLLWAGEASRATGILTALDRARDDGAPSTRRQGAGLRSALDFLYPESAGQVLSAARGGRRSAGAPDHRHDGGRVAADDAERVLQERGQGDPALILVSRALTTLIYEGMLDRAAFWCKVLLKESGSPSDSPFRHSLLTGFLAMTEIRWGDLAAAEDRAHTALTLLTRKAWGVAIGVPLSSLLLVAAAAGRFDDGAGYLQVPVPDAMFGTCYGLFYLHARGEYYLASGRPEEALADFLGCGERMVAWGLDLPGLVPWRTKAAEACLVLGDSLRARQFARDQLVKAGPGPTRTRGISLRALALTSHVSERTGLLREAAEILRDAGARLELACTFSELSGAHRALGEHARAEWAARQARNLAEQCGIREQRGILEPGAGGDGERVDQSEAPPVRAVSAKSLARLSDAERRVASLAAYGYTNAEISSKLYITVSTVEQHLTRVYRKLGVPGRGDLPVQM